MDGFDMGNDRNWKKCRMEMAICTTLQVESFSDEITIVRVGEERKTWAHGSYGGN